MLDHVGLKVRDLQKSRAFYEAALKPLGYAVIMDFGTAVGFGAHGKPEFWLSEGETPTGPIHVAFKAPNRAAVTAFYEAAIAAGGQDNGGPGLRPQYHRGYYGAFVWDPDGINAEAACHVPEQD